MKSRKNLTVVAIVLTILIFSGCSSKKSSEKVNLETIITKKTVTEKIVTGTIKQETSVSTKKIVNDTRITSKEVPEVVEVEPTDYINIIDLPENLLDKVKSWQETYPNMSIGVGLYSLDGTKGYEYNADCFINSACTIKAAYALYVLEEAENKDIDIWNTYIEYQKRHSDDGSGEINLYGEYGMTYSIGYLVYLMLNDSDNVAYNMLLDEFSLNDFYVQNIAIGGENDWQKWGKATVNQRKNEWVAIWSYINSGRRYSQVLRDDLANSKYAYFLEGMSEWHSYLQKSGWTEDTPDYPATCEAAIIDDSYLLIVLTEDYSCDSGHIDVLQSIGRDVETFWYENDGLIF